MSASTGRSRSAAAVASLALVASALVVGGVGSAAAAPERSADRSAQRTALPDRLAQAVTLGGVNRHLIALQRIADTHDGNRAANTPGYDASVDYVAGQLRRAGFEVRTPQFTYQEIVVDAATLSVAGTDYDLLPLEFSPSTPAAGVDAPLTVVPVDATPGCEVTDYAGATGTVVLVQRGTCSFAQKQQAAADAGAVGVVIYNNVPGQLAGGTLGSPDAARLPTGGMSREDGLALAAASGSPVNLDLRTHPEDRVSRNVIAQTRTGARDNVVMAGAHLDSVDDGAGINDNGSGSAGLLETALRLGGSPDVPNAVRFAWWGAEELGLLGSEAYVAGLSFERQLDIALYLNFDMIGSPNAAYFVYDGDDSDGVGAGPGPFGSAQIEGAFTDYLQNRRHVPVRGTDFNGRSDYGPFIAVGIPSGGLFTGAEGIKTADEAALWGGRVGVAYDSCYHTPCDDLGNLDRTALDRNSDAIAYVTATYALSTEDVNGVPSRAERAQARAATFGAPTAHHHTVAS